MYKDNKNIGATWEILYSDFFLEKTGAGGSFVLCATS